jgi:hypothetical protein
MLFRVVEDNGDRCVIAPVDCDLPIVPTELVAREALEFLPVNQTTGGMRV